MTREILSTSRGMRLVCRLVLGAAIIAFHTATRDAMGQAETGASSEVRSFPVSIQVDATNMQGEMRPVWGFFGYDEPNYTYMKDGQKLLSQLSGLASPSTVYVRTHNLLTSGDGRPALKWGSTGVYSEDDQGKPHYNWSILDRIFDTYKERQVCGHTFRLDSCRRLFRLTRSLINTSGFRAGGNRFPPAGPTHRTTTRSGPNSCSSG